MQTKFSILEPHGQVVAYSSARPSSSTAIGSALAAGVVTAYTAYNHFGGQAAAGVAMATAAVVAATSYRSSSHQSHAELRATRQELVSEGVGADTRPFKRRAACFDVQWLEYRSEPDAGLYAVLANESIRILPDVTERQAAEVIERIENQFPELRRQWAQYRFGP